MAVGNLGVLGTRIGFRTQGLGNGIPSNGSVRGCYKRYYGAGMSIGAPTVLIGFWIGII